MKRSSLSRSMAALAAIAVVVGACSSSSTAPRRRRAAASAAASAAAASPCGRRRKTYTIGYSNGGGVGNGFREEQVCTAKAQATASGQVSKLTVIHRNTDAAGQLSDIRDLIAKGVNAIVFNPNDPDALNPALAEAQAAGIVTVSVDAYVTDPNTWNLYNNQVKYAELGAKWLFEQMGGTGTVWYTRGLAGNSADTDRDIGFKNVLKEYPEHQGRPDRGRRLHRLGSGHDDPADQRLHRQRPVRQDPGHLGVGHGQADRRRDQGGQQAVRADRGCRHRRRSSPSSSIRPTTRASRARP